MIAIPSAPRFKAVFLTSSLLLLAMTLVWHIPLMLWDHIDLVPMYQAWDEGRLASSEFWRVHDGSHLHTAAYAVLLLTTWLSGGQPWLDCVVSWSLLTFQALLILRIAARSLGQLNLAWGWWAAFLFLALYPGHLVNLQWGWQVAVFISLLGAVMPVYFLTAHNWNVWSSLAGLALAIVGVLGFTTTLAIFPIAVLLIALRQELSWRRRVLYALPWLLALIALLAWLKYARLGGSVPLPGIDAFFAYILNYLGGGVLRFAGKLAPLWALVGLLTGLLAVVKARSQPALRPWLALMLFGIGSAALTAIGRASVFGAEHAFVLRYVSFSSLFWIGWSGAMLLAFHGGPVWRRGWRTLVVVTLSFAVLNGAHMIKKAVVIADRSREYAEHIRTHYPALDPVVLDKAYEGRAPQAQERLGVLREYGFAPFGESAAKDAKAGQ